MLMLLGMAVFPIRHAFGNLPDMAIGLRLYRSDEQSDGREKHGGREVKLLSALHI
jgi:hypothetical protein